MTKQKTSSTKKRHGQHHRKTKNYHATYWPYIPVLILLGSMFLLALLRSPPQTDVLAFATEMNSESLLKETNRQRGQLDQTPLKLNEQLSQAARDKAEDMARNNYWSHISPEGQEPWEFIDETGYAYLKAGENLAYGFMSSRQTVNGWMNSPTHRDNMLDADFQEVGFGYVNAYNFQGLEEETIIVALYAEPSEHGTPTTTNQQPQNEPTTHDNNATTVMSMTVPQNNQDVKSITRLQSLVGGQFAWMTFGLGIVSGTAAVGLFVSHGIRLRWFFKQSEKYVLHHPLLDISLVSLLLLTAFLASHVGFIL